MLMRMVAPLVAICALTGCATPSANGMNSAARQACSVTDFGDFALAVDFRRGDLDERECALRRIAEAGRNPAVDEPHAVADNFVAVREGVGLLHAFYNLRAKRQQTFLDIWAGLTFVGAAGGLEGNLSTTTRQAWGVAAFAPVVISQFNAYEPTRELFHGGALALQLITTRYDRLDRALTVVDASAGAHNCRALDTLVDKIGNEMKVARGPLPSQDPEGRLIAEARRLQRDCIALESNSETMARAVSHSSHIRSMLAADYAASVLELDHALLAKDRDLRYTPGETLGAILASPLRAADSLLTGQNTQVAINSLKTQVAFTGLNRSLGTVRLPPLPGRPAEVAAISPGVDELDQAGAEPRRAVFARHLTELRREADRLRRAQRQQEFGLLLASEYATAAASDYLTFTFDPTTSTTTIALGPRPTAQNPWGTATTTAGAAAPLTP